MHQVLHEAGADLTAKDEIGWTAAMWAAAQGHADTLVVLKSAGLDITVGVYWSILYLNL